MILSIACREYSDDRLLIFYERAVSVTQFEGSNMAYFNTIVHTGIPRLSKQKENEEYALGSMQS
jgi:hypothetical protein